MILSERWVMLGSWFSFDWVLAGFALELSSLLCAHARFSCFGLTAQDENSATKSARTCPFITARGKNLISDWLSSTAHFKSLPDRSALDKIFFSGNFCVHCDGVCLEIMHEISRG